MPLTSHHLSVVTSPEASANRGSSDTIALQPTALALLGESPPARQLRQHLSRIAPYYRRTLLTGEAGSGKEGIARFLHASSPAARGPFILCNAEGLAADGSAIEAARRGTLFIDDISHLDLGAQDGLIRRLVTLEHKVRARTYETRVIAASHTDLKPLSLTGEFRQDLYACVSVIELRVPPLRERLEDFDRLAEFLLKAAAGNPGALDSDARARLLAYRWPGNLREFEHVMGEAIRHARNDSSQVIALRHLPEWNASAPSQTQLMEPPSVAKLDEVMRRHVIAVLSRCAGNKLKAAELLGISRSTLYRMLEG
jgi:two-component system response regulator HydG